ncbi:MAG: hypothetical protein GY772_14660 [bacterium]|nr:hypothetical protein [bacterium]
MQSAFQVARAGGEAAIVEACDSRGGGVAAVPSIMARAAAFRVKYRMSSALTRIPVEQVGFHPCNRDGQPPNGERCLELCRAILEMGYDACEADSAGVVVAAVPGSEEILRFNREACSGDDLLADVRVPFLGYGSLSHSHLNQIMKNIKAGVAGRIPQICGRDGGFSVERLRAVDAPFASACDGGLPWEILGSAIVVEEPEACTIIQAALNSKNGLYLVAHEMQALAALSRICFTFAVAERHLSFEAARAKFCETMPAFARDPNFADLFRFVVDLGASAGPFLQDLRDFHEKKRSLRR